MNSTIQDVLDGHIRWTVLHADNAEVLPTLTEMSVDHVITDGPYSEHVHGKQRRTLRGSGGREARDGNRRGEVEYAPLGFDALTAEHRLFCAEQFGRLTRRWCLSFSDLESTEAWLQDLVLGGMRRWRFGIWNKLNCQPQLSGTGPAVGSEGIAIAHSAKAMRWNGGGLPARWDFPIATDNNGRSSRVHTTQKPLPLCLALIEQFTDPDDVVLDPFSGAATIGVACILTGRRYIGIERDATYHAAGVARLQGGFRLKTPRDVEAGQRGLFEVES